MMLRAWKTVLISILCVAGLARADTTTDTRARLQALVDARPDLARLRSIGTSFEGRDLWLLAIGPADPHACALWLDAAHDGRDDVAEDVALRVAEHLLTALPADSLARLLNGATLYVLPRANPDGTGNGLIPRPDDDDHDRIEDEDPPDDVDGDGRITWMRVPDPGGDWVADKTDPRVLVERMPDDDGPFYRRYREGKDDDGDGLINEDDRGGISLLHNFPAGWEMPHFVPHSGPYSPSERETVAILEFFVSHPEIGLAVTLSQGDRPEQPGVGTGGVDEDDEDAYAFFDAEVDRIRGHGLKTDYENPGRAELGGAGQTLMPPAKERPAPTSPRAVVPGSFLEWAYGQWGAYALSPQVWVDAPPVAADTTATADSLDTDDTKTPRDERTSKWIDWASANRPDAFVAWHPVTHPNLGTAEVGGLDPDALRLADDADLDSLTTEVTELVTVLLRAMPHLRIDAIHSTALSADLYRVSAVVRNAGRLPTMSAQGAKARLFHPVAVDLETSEGASLVDSPSRILVGRLDAGERTTAEWLVRGRAGTPVTIRVTSVRAGTAAASIRLGEEGATR